jgi:hypothetical protein
VHAQKRLLGDLARVLLVAHQAERDRKNATLMALDQQPERAAVTGLRALNEAPVLFGFVFTFHPVGRGLLPPIQPSDISIMGETRRARRRLQFAKK